MKISDENASFAVSWVKKSMANKSRRTILNSLGCVKLQLGDHKKNWFESGFVKLQFLPLPKEVKKSSSKTIQLETLV